MRANKKRGRPFFFLFLKNETLKKRGEKKGGSERQPVFWINDYDIVNLYGNTNFKDARRAGIHSSRNRRSTRRRRRGSLVAEKSCCCVIRRRPRGGGGGGGFARHSRSAR